MIHQTDVTPASVMCDVVQATRSSSSTLTCCSNLVISANAWIRNIIRRCGKRVRGDGAVSQGEVSEVVCL